MGPLIPKKDLPPIGFNGGVLVGSWGQPLTFDILLSEVKPPYNAPFRTFPPESLALTKFHIRGPFAFG
jgi:hypothetical protein